MAIKKKIKPEATNSKESKVWYMGLGGGKGRGNDIIIL